MQMNLFSMPRLKEPISPAVARVNRLIPGASVTLPGINDGIEAEVVYVFEEQLRNENAYPVRCWIPKLKIHVRQKLDQVVLKTE